MAALKLVFDGRGEAEDLVVNEAGGGLLGRVIVLMMMLMMHCHHPAGWSPDPGLGKLQRRDTTKAPEPWRPRVQHQGSTLAFSSSYASGVSLYPTQTSLHLPPPPPLLVVAARAPCCCSPSWAA